jgi:hypothetical protein
MIKLLRHGALSYRECVVITGWPESEVKNTLSQLRYMKRIKRTQGYNKRYFIGQVPA